MTSGFGTAIYFPDLDEEMGVNEIFGVSEDVLYELAGFRKGPLGRRSDRS